MKKVAPKPTDAELSILQALWRKGPSTLKEVHREVFPPAGYGTVQKFLSIMMDKGLVRRDTSNWPCVYEAAYSEEQIQQNLVTGLLKKAFGGSPAKLLMQALASNKTSAEEIASIRRLCEKHKKS